MTNIDIYRFTKNYVNHTNTCERQYLALVGVLTVIFSVLDTSQLERSPLKLEAYPNIPW